MIPFTRHAGTCEHVTLRGYVHLVYMYTACMDTNEVMVNDTIVTLCSSVSANHEGNMF